MNDYIVNIPNGYQYCHDCELITPHSEKTKFGDFICDICGGYEVEYCKCPNCGWNHEPDRDLHPETIKVKKHHKECEWFNVDESSDSIDIFTPTEECDCPEVDCYSVPHIFNYLTSSAYYNTECFGAMNWSYEIRCPICYTVFEVEDGNC